MKGGNLAKRMGVRFVLIVGVLIGVNAGALRVNAAQEHSTEAAANAPVFELCLGKQRPRFDPHVDRDLERLGRLAQAALGNDKAAEDATPLWAHDKKCRRGLHEIEHLADAATRCADPDQKRSLIALLLETVQVVNNSQRSPVPERMDALETPWFFIRQIHSPVARGRTPATNLQPGPHEDLSRLDPLPSTFWHAPADIANQNLYDGFGRKRLFQIEDKMCHYDSAKQSYGRNAGCQVDCEGIKVRLKFAEVSSEPFATRIFAALGYNTDPTDYAPQVKIRYAREFFLEFNSRKPLSTRFTFFWLIPLFRMDLQKQHDPFDYIAQAVLHDGRCWSGHELKSHLLRDPRRPSAEPANFRSDIESAIDYLVTVPANVQANEVRGKSIGPWDFEQLDHADRRELRGLGVLAAWLGWFDTRFDNTRLKIVRTGGTAELSHYISDLGGVLGETKGLLYARGERPNSFPWTFTRAPLWQGLHRLALPLRIEGYKPIALTPAFAAMTIDDARWLARRIGQLTERQIVQALVASGFDSGEVRLYTEKLVSRRDRMIIDLGLDNEIALCRPGGVKRDFSYDPIPDGPVSIDVPNHIQLQAPVGKHWVLKGKLVGRPALPQPRH